MNSSTADLYDEHGEALLVLEPILRNFGGARAFSGPIATARVFEDNARVREALEEPGAGRVLVVDGEGSVRCALVGDRLAELAVKNGWSGIVVYGAIRDSAAIAKLPLGVLALATNPRKSIKRGSGSRDVPVSFGGVTFTPGAQLFADEDGLVVSPTPLR